MKKIEYNLEKDRLIKACNEENGITIMFDSSFDDYAEKENDKVILSAFRHIASSVVEGAKKYRKTKDIYVMYDPKRNLMITTIDILET